MIFNAHKTWNVHVGQCKGLVGQFQDGAVLPANIGLEDGAISHRRLNATSSGSVMIRRGFNQGFAKLPRHSVTEECRQR